MANKEFKISARLDTSGFDQSIKELQQKLATVQMASTRQQTAGRAEKTGIGGLSSSSMEAFQKATQASRRELDQLIASEVRGQERLSKLVAEQDKSIKSLSQKHKENNKDLAEQEKIQQKISKVEENRFKMVEQYTRRQAILDQALDAKEQMTAQNQANIRARNPEGWGRAGRFAGAGMYGAAGREAFKSAGGWGGLGGALGFIGALGERGAEAYRNFGSSPIRTEGAMGSAVSGGLGRQVGDIYGRRSAFEQMFAPERQRASAQALESLRTAQIADKYGAGFGLLKSAGVGMGAGAAVGALGFGAGAAPGALIGGALGLGKGALDIMGDERKLSRLMSPFSDTANKRYQSILAEEMIKNYTTSYEGQKQQNPFKTAATGEYEQNWQRNLQSQRSMGLGNQGFYGPGGFMSSNIGAGFTPEMGLQMSGDILGAGGSTRMARESAFGNQMSRGLDMTNSGQILGTLSGGIGGSESTKQATVKILAEGMKLGLDDSKFAEENRKFAQMTAEIVARSGAKTEGDFERVTGGFGRFVGENTTLGLGAAKTAYEQYQQISQTTTGPRGVMRAAGFMGDRDLNKLSTMTKQALMQVPEGDLNEENPLVQAAADEAGISAKEVVRKVTGVNQGAVSRFKDADTIRDRLKTRMKDIGKERLSEEDLKTLPEDMQKDIRKLTTFQTTELGYQGQRETMARALGTINPADAGAGKQLGRENIIGDKLTRDTGRMEDTTVKSMAADSKVVLDNFNEMAPAMKKAAESTALWTREVRENAAALQQALDSARQNKNADTLKSLEDIMKRMSGSGGNQQQTGPTGK